MRMQRAMAVGAAVALIAVLAWLLWDTPEHNAQAQNQGNAKPAPAALVGSPGSFFGAIVDQPHRSSVEEAKISTDAQSEVDRLWPHIRKGEPTEADRAKVRVQWVNFSIQHPDNIYIPNEFKPPITASQAKAVRQQLDDTTALVAKQAAQKHLDRFAQNQGTNPVEVTEQQARDSGVTPDQQRNFFNYKIKELESRIQLVEFYLNSDDLDTNKKAAAKKELIVWKKELEELVRIRAQVPNS